MDTTQPTIQPLELGDYIVPTDPQDLLQCDSCQ